MNPNPGSNPNPMSNPNYQMLSDAGTGLFTLLYAEQDKQRQATLLDIYALINHAQKANSDSDTPPSDYKCDKLQHSDLESFKFIASTPLIPVPRIAFKVFYIDPSNFQGICDVTDKIYCNISQHVVGFLGWIRTAYSEDGLHAGTDFFLKIVMGISGAQQFRNHHEKTSITTTRPDSWLSLMGITLVRVEEKSAYASLKQAQNDLTRKMKKWPPHLEKVPFIVGIAIAGSLWSFHTIDHQHNLSSTAVTLDISKVVDRITAVRIAVQLGRLLLLYKDILSPTEAMASEWPG